MRNVNRENIMEHSLQVAMIAHGLAVINNKIFGGNADPEKTALLAIYHDSNETITGDLPTPIKYFNQGMESSYKDLETISKHKLLSLLPEELAESYKEILFYDETSLEGRLVKAADRICAYIKCVEELKAGNAEFQKAQQSILKRILGLNLPEIGYFMNHFMHPFCLTLDELN
jgi:5'-deoxynucleotidase